MGRFFCFAWVLPLAACEVLPPDLESEARDASSVAVFDAAPVVVPDASPVGPPPMADAALSPPDAGPQQADAASDAAGGALSPGCSYVSWPSPDVPPAYHACAVAPATGCTCSGVPQPAPPTDLAGCLQTLAATCRVDFNVRTGCEHAYGGGCWPSASAADAWLCECRASGQRGEVRAPSCRAAGATLCRPPLTPCEDKTGRCTPNAEGSFTCECPIDYPLQHTINADVCFKALRVACVSSLGRASAGEDCMSESFTRNAPPAGACFGKDRLPQDGFDCSCDTGNGNLRQSKVVAPSCGAALAYFCPEAAPL